jgi:uncharacterized protein (TIGR03437 family)
VIRKLFPAAAAPLLFAASLLGQVPAGLASFSTFLKANSFIQQVATDAQGFIYVYGETALNPGAGFGASYGQNVFVARVDPAATTLTYVIYLGDSSNTYVGAMAVDSAGNAYITGYTNAPDFPTVRATPGPSSADAHVPFVAKVNINGAIVYSTLFSNGVAATPQSIAVDSAGDVIVSGPGSSAGFPVTAGAYDNAWTTAPPFITKIDPTGTKIILSSIGVGGSSIALDGSGNIVVAGTTDLLLGPSSLYPTTPGAFQTAYTPYTFCASPSCGFIFSVGEQYVSKLSGDGSTLLYSTFVTGSLGASNAGMALDTSGDVWLTGDTSSADYPYTQSTVPAPGTTPLSGTFTTELDPTLSKVLMSVPQGVSPGSGSNLTIDPQGNLVVAGTFPTLAIASSLPAPAPPSIGNTPLPCLPGGAGAYIMRISSQDGSVLGTQILSVGNQETGDTLAQISSTVDSQGNIYVAGSTGLPDVPLTPGVVYDPAVTQRTIQGAFLERTSLSLPPSPLECVTDSANATLIGPVAPGQLLTLYGNGIGPTQPVVGLMGGEADVPTLLGGVGVTFDGQPAPILYVSATQINVQVPFGVKQNPSTVMQLSYNGSVLATRMLAVAPQNPSVFVGPVLTNLTCGNTQFGGSVVTAALALNEDGSVNSCANPARSGSLLTLFINGIGTAASNQNTGGLTGSNPGSDAQSLAVFVGGYSIEVDAFTDMPNAISGVGQITARVPDTVTLLQPMYVTVMLDGLPAGPLGNSDGLGAGGSPISVLVFVTP